jgi:hypothetical protein
MEKARRISSQFDLSRYPEVYAYGDTSEDLEMLALAHRKYYRWKDFGSFGHRRRGSKQRRRSRRRVHLTPHFGVSHYHSAPLRALDS